MFGRNPTTFTAMCEGMVSFQETFIRISNSKIEIDAKLEIMGNVEDK
jgi:hypothetical protein